MIRKVTLDEANELRKKLPFWYWPVYDVIAAVLFAWGYISLSRWFGLGLVMLLLSIVIDAIEAMWKWRTR